MAKVRKNKLWAQPSQRRIPTPGWTLCLCVQIQWKMGVCLWYGSRQLNPFIWISKYWPKPLKHYTDCGRILNLLNLMFQKYSYIPVWWLPGSSQPQMEQNPVHFHQEANKHTVRKDLECRSFRTVIIWEQIKNLICFRLEYGWTTQNKWNTGANSKSSLIVCSTPYRNSKTGPPAYRRSRVFSSKDFYL